MTTELINPPTLENIKKITGAYTLGIGGTVTVTVSGYTLTANTIIVLTVTSTSPAPGHSQCVVLDATRFRITNTNVASSEKGFWVIMGEK